ncbi:MAG TPA: DNA alkylation repair protein [Pseudonocardiaceae bacterium]|nr:DNA alkylation repair protein [Pseudonocardiaceae bacterium]
MVDHELVAAARRGLAELADPVKAPQMQRYMRSAMPYRGVQAPAWRPLARRLARDHPLADVAALAATVGELWHGARFREERYVALELTSGRRWQRLDLLPLYEELIVDGAWWDYVDLLAIHRVGPLLRLFPAAVTPVVRGWATDDSLWLRRSAVICQVGSKAATYTRLLAYCVERNVGDRDFFLRKGIGWALREFSRTDPGWVVAFVESHPELSPLSRREATRRLPVG